MTSSPYFPPRIPSVSEGGKGVAVMGLDPGTQGAVCVVGRNGSPVFVEGFNRKMTENVLVDLLTRAAWELLDRGGGGVCVMEKVGFIKGDGGKGAFTFGGVYKFARAVLLVHGVRISDVTPLTWMVHMNCLTGGDKKVSREEARRRWPDWEPTLTTADAMLIARYGWEVLNRRQGAEPHLSPAPETDQKPRC